MFLFSFIFVIFAQPTLSCPMQEILRNIHNPDALERLVPRKIQHGDPIFIPPSTGKAVYSHGGEWWWNGATRSTNNFYITYYENEASSQVVDMTEKALEDAWQVFIEEEDWPMPISTEQYLLWVVLDPYPLILHQSSL